jgi:adenosylcobinamide-phosphate synthase
VIDRKVLAGAYLLDWVAGDPEWLPHPVKLVGKAIDNGERMLRKPGQSPATEFLAGCFLSLSLIAAAYLGTAKSIAWANRRSRWQGLALETMLAWTCLASRSLHDEAVAVIAALEGGDLVLARLKLARIVGRNTQHLEEEEVTRAVIETLAESASDGVIAPLFYLAAGGVPLAMAYKTINTLDSMIGHTDERYFYFGKVAARLDDIANILPARLTALGIVVSASVLEGTAPKTALAIWLRDGMKHKSPNAGQPESAMAGALQVRLGGENFYGGMPIKAPLLGPEFPAPATRKARQAIQIVASISLLGVIAALLLTGQRR